MSWHQLASKLWLALALVGCARAQGPAPEPADPSATSQARHQERARARLRAVIRDQSFLEQLPELVRATTLSEPFAGRMVVLYMVDDHGAARGAQAADLAEAGVTREALRAVVEWNLARAVRGPLSCTSHLVGEPAHRDYYESSRLLLKEPWSELARAGKVVVAVPSNDTLFVACNPTPAILQRLAAVVQNTYPKATGPVSPALLTWSEDGWRELPAP